MTGLIFLAPIANILLVSAGAAMVNAAMELTAAACAARTLVQLHIERVLLGWHTKSKSGVSHLAGPFAAAHVVIDIRSRDSNLPAVTVIAAFLKAITIRVEDREYISRFGAAFRAASSVSSTGASVPVNQVSSTNTTFWLCWLHK